MKELQQGFKSIASRLFLHRAVSHVRTCLYLGVCYTTRGGGNPSVSRAGEGYGLTVITMHEDARDGIHQIIVKLF
jgi:hypothetical protein